MQQLNSGSLEKFLLIKRLMCLSHLKEIPIPFKQGFESLKVACIFMQVYDK